jgi:cAMP-binding proteins - catabolite gene activator and regulatory subunit of cAMP-dependent protein kinases
MSDVMKADLDRYAPAAFGGVLTFGGINLSRAESASLVRQLGAIQTHRPNVRLMSEGDALDRPRLIRSGWACRVRFLSDGRRQILNYYLPGDIMGLSLEPDPVALAGYASLTRLMTMDIGQLRTLVLEHPDEYPELTAACRKMKVHEEYYLLSQITRIGRQKAYERVAHLLLEFHSRLSRTGLTEGSSFQLPLTQEALADGLGLSAVHVNRTFKLLKRKNLVRIERATVTLLERDALAEMCGFREPDDLLEADTTPERAAVSF